MGEKLMTTTHFHCGHEVKASFLTKPREDHGGKIRENYSMGMTTKRTICPICEANSKLVKSAKDLPEKDKANKWTLALWISTSVCSVLRGKRCLHHLGGNLAGKWRAVGSISAWQYYHGRIEVQLHRNIFLGRIYECTYMHFSGSIGLNSLITPILRWLG